MVFGARKNTTKHIHKIGDCMVIVNYDGVISNNYNLAPSQLTTLRTCIHKRFSRVWMCEILMMASAEAVVIS